MENEDNKQTEPQGVQENTQPLNTQEKPDASTRIVEVNGEKHVLKRMQG